VPFAIVCGGPDRAGRIKLSSLCMIVCKRREFCSLDVSSMDNRLWTVSSFVNVMLDVEEINVPRWFELGGVRADVRLECGDGIT
jgi:hypothetical protein